MAASLTRRCPSREPMEAGRSERVKLSGPSIWAERRASAGTLPWNKETRAAEGRGNVAGNKAEPRRVPAQPVRSL